MINKHSYRMFFSYNKMGDMMDSTIIMIVGFIVSLIAIVTPIVKLNTNITKLNMTMTCLNEAMEEVIKNIDNHEKRIIYLESRVKGGNDGDYNS